MPTNYLCANCHGWIFRWRGYGDWYHKKNASVSCSPGNSRRKADPIEVAAP